jgi:hypothetical protein
MPACSVGQSLPAEGEANGGIKKLTMGDCGDKFDGCNSECSGVLGIYGEKPDL